jgi:hypothetical protein
LLGLLQLSGDSLLFCRGKLQIILGIKHIEIGFGCVNHQVLQFGQICSFGLGDLIVGLA